MAKRTQYYCPFLTPSALPPLLSREFPRTPAGGRWRPPCQRGLAALADWGIPTGLTLPPVIFADGQESLRLACARHLPLTREAFLAGSARAKGSPLRGELAAPAGLRGFAGLSAAARHPFAAQSTPNSTSPSPFSQTLQTLHALHKTCPLFAKPLPRLYRTMVETGAKPRYN